MIKGGEKEGNVLPFKGRQSRMFIVEGEDGLTHLVPENKVQPELPQPAKVIDMFPSVPYELMGVTGLETEIFEADRENPIMGHEGRGVPHEPFDPDDTRPPAA